MSFGSNLARIMADRGKSQSDLARALGIESQAVNQWFKNRTVPQSRRLKKIAEVLEVQVSDLVEDQLAAVARQNNAQDRSGLSHKATKLDLVALWDAMDDEVKVALMTVAQALAVVSKRTRTLGPEVRKKDDVLPSRHPKSPRVPKGKKRG